MNPEMEKRIQEARDAGYSEEEIQAELAIMQGTAPAPQVQPQTPIDRTEEYNALGQGVGLEAAKMAGYGAVGAYGLKKLADVVRGPVAPPTPTQPGATQRILSQAMGRPGMVSTPPAVNPAVSPSYAAPSAAQPAAAAPQQPGAVRQGLQQGMEYANKVRQIAMDKVMQNAGTIGKAGLGAAAALTPGNIGQKYNFPTSGPMRGMEINPQTGRPWTPQELSALGQ